MENSEFVDILRETPIIAAIKSNEGLEKSLVCDKKIIFILYGDILTIADIVSRIKNAGKVAFVHIDLIEGLAARDVSIDFLAKHTKADGIISTKSTLIRRAKAHGLLTIQRFFVLDSMALENIQKQIPFEYADVVEILPGAMPKVIQKVAGLTNKPVIASGLIYNKEDVISALNANATSVSSTNFKTWDL